MVLALDEIFVTPIVQRCSLLYDQATRQGAVIDPGGDVDLVLSRIALLDLSIERIVLTHGHLDHAGGAEELRERLGGVAIVGPHRDDDFLLKTIAEDAVDLGIQGLRACTPDRWLDDGDAVVIAGRRMLVRHCPGHTPGSILLISAEEHLAVVGDVLFAGSIGRTDFAYGDRRALLDDIARHLLPLADDTKVVCGHGPLTTIGRERRSNPHLRQLRAA
jgi:glyoxylase-like metal-dependent hydrolase (beta-lactamase superfamily II)